MWENGSWRKVLIYGRTRSSTMEHEKWMILKHM